MRRSPTAAGALRQALRNRQLGGVKFRRQHAVGNYIVDLISTDHKLIVEVDGDVHAEESQAEYDLGRSFNSRASGSRILRFSNGQVINDWSAVLSQIQQDL
ncbi:MAG: DUF559 domain-containing protein [Hymenobacter sp.]|nr:DUF559 domain-containing protein [Hymenobacter sp.]